MVRSLVPICTVAMLVAAMSAARNALPVAGRPGGTGRWVVRETSLGPAGAKLVESSPDRRHIARVVTRGTQERVLLDRTEGPPCDSIKRLLFSPDSRRLAYLAKREGTWRFFVDGKEVARPYLGSFWNDHIPTFSFSPDGSRWFAEGFDDSRRYRFLLEGQIDPHEGGTVSIPGPSPECATGDGQRFVFLRGEGSPGVMSPAFPVTLAIYGPQGEESYPRFEVALWDWNLYECRFLGDGLCEFSPDGRRLIHLARDPGTGSCALVLDRAPIGKGGREFKPPVFSPDSARFACPVKQSDGWRVAVDAREEGPFEAIGDGWDALGRKRQLFFSPDSRRLGYSARNRNQWYVVIDGRAGEPYDRVGRPVFSSDGQRVAHRAKRGKHWFVILDGSAGTPYDQVEDEAVSERGTVREDVQFSADGKHVCYRASARGKTFVVLDTHEGPAYDEVASVAFSPSGEHTAYVAKRGGRWFLVIDGVEGGDYDFLTEQVQGGLGLIGHVLTDRRVVFDGPRQLHTLIRRNQEYFLLEAEIPEAPTAGQ